MDIREYSANSLSYIGDAVFTLRVRQFFIDNGYQSARTLQHLCNGYNSASGQRRVFERLEAENFFSEEELEIYKRGRNHISHIPKSSDRLSYEIATGLEALCGYLYLSDTKRLDEFFSEVFKGGIENE